MTSSQRWHGMGHNIKEAVSPDTHVSEASETPSMSQPISVTIEPSGEVEPTEGGEELPIENQGDLITGNKEGVPVILPVGEEDGEVLTVNSSEPDGIIWEPPETGSSGTGLIELYHPISPGEKLELPFAAPRGGIALIAISPNGGGAIKTPTWNGVKMEAPVSSSGSVTVQWFLTPETEEGEGVLGLEGLGGGVVYAIFIPSLSKIKNKGTGEPILTKFQFEPANPEAIQTEAPSGLILGCAIRQDGESKGRQTLPVLISETVTKTVTLTNNTAVVIFVGLSPNSGTKAIVRAQWFGELHIEPAVLYQFLGFGVYFA